MSLGIKYDVSLALQKSAMLDPGSMRYLLVKFDVIQRSVSNVLLVAAAPSSSVADVLPDSSMNVNCLDCNKE